MLVIRELQNRFETSLERFVSRLMKVFTTTILIATATFVFVTAVCGQTTTKPDQKAEEPQETKVYYQKTREPGELKDCVTLAEENSLLLCEASWFDKVLGCMDKGLSSDVCHRTAISDIREESKSFLVEFSEKPWPRKDTKGWWYKCRKGETVTCTREETPR
jgi:hypothetical protein